MEFSGREWLRGCSKTGNAWSDVLEHSIFTLCLGLVMAFAIWIMVSWRLGSIPLLFPIAGVYLLLAAAIEIAADSIFGVDDVADLVADMPEWAIIFAALPTFMVLWLTVPVAIIVPLWCRLIPSRRGDSFNSWLRLSAYPVAAFCSAAVAWYLLRSWFGTYEFITGGMTYSNDELEAQALESAWYGVGFSALPIALIPLALMILRRGMGRRGDA